MPSFRSRRFLRELRPSLRKACERRGFRVVHYSVQRNHLHLLVESAGKENLGRGMKAISARVARAAQQARLGSRARCSTVATTCGSCAHRARSRPGSPTYRSTRASTGVSGYGAAPAICLDEASSGRWFDGWRRHRLVDPAEVPGG